MPDIADLAEGVTEMLLQESLRQQIGKGEPQRHPDFDGLHCVDCEEEIPPLRLTQWRVRCVPCQEDADSLTARGLR